MKQKINQSELSTPFYSDVDGVFLNFSAGFFAFMEATLGVVATKPEPDNFDYSDVFSGIDTPAKYIKPFINSSDFFVNIPPYEDAKSAIESLIDAGVLPHFITSMKCSDLSELTRTNNINNLLKMPPKITCLNLGECKSDIMNSLPSGIFVDDQVSVCDGVNALNKHRVFLLDRRYNQQNTHPNITRIKSLFQLPYFI